MKRNFSLLATLTVMIALIFTQTFGAQKVNNSEIEYKVTGGTLLFDSRSGSITGYRGNLTEVEIPSSINDFEVTGIRFHAFLSCKGLTKVILPNTITNIESGAFYLSPDLKSINIPNSVISIGSDAFFGCSALASISIPSSVTSIGNNVFYNCIGLTSIEVSEDNPNYKSKDGILFNKNMSTLIRFPAKKDSTQYKIPNSVTKIGFGAFEGCSGLKSISIPNSVTSIESWAFNNCKSLTSINIPTGYTDIETGVFASCSSLKSISIPNSIKSIGEEAFWGCSSLTSITIPNSVTYISSHAFAECTGLTSISIPNSVTRIAYGMFRGCSGLKSIRIPESVTDISQDAFLKCSNLTSINIPKSVTSIADHPFIGCNKLVITGLSPSTAETYAKANDIKFVKIVPATKPAAPTGLSVTINNNNASLTWKAVVDATSYKVYYKNQNGDYKVLTAKSTKLQIPNLSKSTKYFFKVTAVNTAGEGKPSAEITKTTSK